MKLSYIQHVVFFVTAFLLAANTISAHAGIDNRLPWQETSKDHFHVAINADVLKQKDDATTHHLIKHIFNYYGYRLDGTGNGQRMNPFMAMTIVPPAERPRVQQFLQENMGDLQKGALSIRYNRETNNFIVTGNGYAKNLTNKLLQQADISLMPSPSAQ